jgi:hypothetical protein
VPSDHTCVNPKVTVMTYQKPYESLKQFKNNLINLGVIQTRLFRTASSYSRVKFKIELERFKSRPNTIILEVIFRQDLCKCLDMISYPNMRAAFRIILTLPITKW